MHHTKINIASLTLQGHGKTIMGLNLIQSGSATAAIATEAGRARDRGRDSSGGDNDSISGGNARGIKSPNTKSNMSNKTKIINAYACVPVVTRAVCA
jgi:hypothetical protein